MEHVKFIVVEIPLPYNTILGCPKLYRLMTATHYGYLVLKVSGHSFGDDIY
jgi:hypothetical protein